MVSPNFEMIETISPPVQKGFYQLLSCKLTVKDTTQEIKVKIIPGKNPFHKTIHMKNPYLTKLMWIVIVLQ